MLPATKHILQLSLIIFLFLSTQNSNFVNFVNAYRSDATRHEFFFRDCDVPFIWLEHWRVVVDVGYFYPYGAVVLVSSVKSSHFQLILQDFKYDLHNCKLYRFGGTLLYKRVWFDCATSGRYTYVGDVFVVQLTVDFDFSGRIFDQERVVDVAFLDAVRDRGRGVVVQSLHFRDQSVQVGVFRYFFRFVNGLGEMRGMVVFVGDFDPEHLFACSTTLNI